MWFRDTTQHLLLQLKILKKIYGAEILSKEDIFRNLLIVKINSLYKYDMSDSQVMECARGHWIIDTKRAENCDYLIAVNHGLIVGVYENMKWYSSGVETPFYPRLCKRKSFKVKSQILHLSSS